MPRKLLANSLDFQDFILKILNMKLPKDVRSLDCPWLAAPFEKSKIPFSTSRISSEVVASRMLWNACWCSMRRRNHILILDWRSWLSWTDIFVQTWRMSYKPSIKFIKDIKDIICIGSFLCLSKQYSSWRCRCTQLMCILRWIINFLPIF